MGLESLQSVITRELSLFDLSGVSWKTPHTGSLHFACRSSPSVKSLYLGIFVKIITDSWLTLWLSDLMDGSYRNNSLTKTLKKLGI